MKGATVQPMMWRVLAAVLAVAAIAVAVFLEGPGRFGALWLGGFALFAGQQQAQRPDGISLEAMRRRALMFNIGVTAALLAALLYAALGSAEDRGRAVATCILLAFLAAVLWTLWWKDRASARSRASN